MRRATEKVEAHHTAHAPLPYAWLLAVALLTLASTLQKIPCLRGNVDTDLLATAQCYSDVPLFYVGRGLAADFGWLGHLNAGFRDLEYPPIINLFIEASAKVTHVVLGIPSAELDRRASMDAAQLYDIPGMAHEEFAFFLVSAAGILIAGLVTAWVAWRAGWRLGDPVVWLVVTPLLVLTLTLNWDVVALPFVALALLAWQRGRLAPFGAFVALGTATKLFPLVLLAAAVILIARTRPARLLVAMLVAFVVTTVAANAPLYLSSSGAWREFWVSNSERPAYFGSLWLALRMIGASVPGGALSLLLLVGVLITWVVLGLLTWRRVLAPTCMELSMVFLLVFFALGKVYSPQYSLWVVLGLFFVTRSRWLIGVVAAVETWHYVATWLYIRGFTTPDTGIDVVYWSSMMLRIAAEGVVVIYLVVQMRRRATRQDPSPAAVLSFAS